MKTSFCLGCVALGLALVAGCATPPPPPSPWRETVSQVSTYEALKAGRYDGLIAVSNLLAFGDTGLGTFHGLDGEMVVLGGVAYQVRYDGAVRAAPGDLLSPFACVTWFEPDLRFDSGAMSQQIFQRSMLWKNRAPEQIAALRVSGVFKRIKVRSVPAQTAPYPALEQVIAEHQQSWEREGVAGTMVGFHIPAALGGVAPAGYHLHFLSDDRSLGGHVLDFDLASGRIEVDLTPVFRVELPPPAAVR